MRRLEVLAATVGVLMLVGVFVLARSQAACSLIGLEMRLNGTPFTLILGGIFLWGMHIIVDRILFCAHYGLLRLDGRAGSTVLPEHDAVLSQILTLLPGMREAKNGGGGLDGSYEVAWRMGCKSHMGGEEIDKGRATLEFLGIVSPMIGFIGTLVGLSCSFQEYGKGGRLQDVLQALGLSLHTSLVGAILSGLFIFAAWWIDGRTSRFMGLCRERTLAEGAKGGEAIKRSSAV